MQHQQNNYKCIKGYFRLLHAVPNAPAVDVYANDILIAKDLKYKEFTEYLPAYPGEYKIEVYLAGTKGNPLIETVLPLDSNVISTVSVVGLAPEIELLPVIEEPDEVPMGLAAVRFSHLSPVAPAVDITLPNGDILFENVKFKETTDYLAVPPEVYTLQARLAGTDQVVLNVPNINLHPDKWYTVYAVGIPGDQPPLQVLIPLDGITYIDVCDEEM